MVELPTSGADVMMRCGEKLEFSMFSLSIHPTMQRWAVGAVEVGTDGGEMSCQVLVTLAMKAPRDDVRPSAVGT